MAGHGRNAGVTGIIDFPAAGVKFQVTLSGWEQGGDVSTRSRVGRGTGRWSKVRRVLSSGNLLCRGRVRQDAFPIPTTFEGVEGQIVIALDAARSVTCQILVTSYKLTDPEDEQTTWQIKLAAQVTAMPTFAGFTGTQPTFTLPTLGDQQTYDGLTKGLDPNDLQSAATQTIDVWAVGDSDAAERTEMATLIAAAIAPLTGMKLRAVNLLPGRDADGCQFQLVWGRTSTAEDVVNESTTETVDVSGLESAATALAINDTPATPTGDTFVATATTTRTLNDGNTATIRTYGLRTPKQAREFDGTFAKTDPSDLESEGHQTSVYAAGGSPTAASVPSGLQLVGTQIVTINPQWKQVEYFYAKDTPQQRVEQANTYTVTDPSGLETTASVAALDATPSTPAGLYVRGSRDQKQTNDHTLTTILCGTRTTQEDREFPGTFYVVDPNALETEGTDTRVYTGTAAPSVSPAHGTKIVATKDEALDHVHRQQTVTLGLTDSKDKVELPGTWYDVDPNALETSGLDTSVFVTDDGEPGDPSPANGTKIVARKIVQLNGINSQRTITLGLADSADKALNPRTTEDKDPNDLDSTKTTAVLIDPDSPPADPSAPSGYKLRHKDDIKLVDGTGTVRVYKWALTDTADDELFRHKRTLTDPNDLDSEQSSALIFATGAPPADPGLPSGFKLVSKDDVPLTASGTSNKSVRVYRYAKNDSKDKIERPGTWTEVDPNALASKGEKAEVYTGSEPADPTPPSGQKIRSKRNWNLDPTNKQRVTEFGVNDTKDEAELDASGADDDPTGGPGSQIGTLIAVDPGDDDATIAEASAAAHRSEADYAGTIIKRKNREQAIEIIKRSGDDKTIRTVGFHTTYDQLKGYASDGVIGTATAGIRIAALLDGNGRVVPPIGGGGGGYTAARIDYRIFTRTRGAIILRRRLIVDDDAARALALHMDAKGSVNDAPFLGYDTDTVMYGGADVRHDEKLLGDDHLLEVDFIFHYDNLGFPNEQNLDVGPVGTKDASTLINVIGLVQADTYFGSNWILSWPGEWDMSVFLD